jgi:hypothetical protein
VRVTKLFAVGSEGGLLMMAPAWLTVIPLTVALENAARSPFDPHSYVAVLVQTAVLDPPSVRRSRALLSVPVVPAVRSQIRRLHVPCAFPV